MLKFKKKKGNLIHPTAVINWKKIIIGKNNVIGPYVVIGSSAQHPKKKSTGKIHIEDNNIINEFTNIHLPTNLKKKTIIGSNNYIMNSCTIDHDCKLENNIVLSSNVILGGNVHLMNGSQLGMKVLVHQNQLIGSFSMIGMGSVITKKTKVLPGFIYFGKPAKKYKRNLLGLKRFKIDKKKLKYEILRFNKIKKKI